MLGPSHCLHEISLPTQKSLSPFLALATTPCKEHPTYSPKPMPTRNKEQQSGHIYYTTLYQPQQTVKKCWTKTILLSQTGMF
jgi:hypothetical protein